jgi:hypothetical protein
MRRSWHIAVGLLLVAGLVASALFERSSPRVPQPEPFLIGYDTTRLTAPLGERGLVDYAAALNAAVACAPEENAAIPILRLLGTASLSGERTRVLALLEAPADLPSDGRLAARSAQVPAINEYRFRELEVADLESLESWLHGNRDVLDDLAQAARRPCLWWPVIADPESGYLTSAVPNSSLSPLTGALQERSWVHLARGRLREGWADAETLLRLHVLADGRPGTVERLVAQSLLRAGLVWVQHACETAAFDASSCVEAIEVIRRLPLRRDLTDDVDRFDRFAVLGSYAHLETVSVERAHGRVAEHPQYVKLNAALRAINTSFDEFVTLLREPSNVVELERRMEARRVRLESLAPELQSPEGRGAYALDEIASEGRAGGELRGWVLATLALAATPYAQRGMRDTELLRRETLVALAARLYAHRTGEFPRALADLVPDPFHALPTDPTTSEPIPYERTDSGCMVGRLDRGIELAR